MELYDKDLREALENLSKEELVKTFLDFIYEHEFSEDRMIMRLEKVAVEDYLDKVVTIASSYKGEYGDEMVEQLTRDLNAVLKQISAAESDFPEAVAAAIQILNEIFLLFEESDDGTSIYILTEETLATIQKLSDKADETARRQLVEILLQKPDWQVLWEWTDDYITLVKLASKLSDDDITKTLTIEKVNDLIEVSPSSKVTRALFEVREGMLE